MDNRGGLTKKIKIEVVTKSGKKYNAVIIEGVRSMGNLLFFNDTDEVYIS